MHLIQENINKLTLSVHLVLDGMGKDRYIKASKVTDFFSQYEHVTVDLNKP